MTDFMTGAAQIFTLATLAYMLAGSVAGIVAAAALDLQRVVWVSARVSSSVFGLQLRRAGRVGRRAS